MSDTRRIPIPLDQRLRRLRLTLVPFIVWLGAAASAGHVWLSGPAQSTFTGLVIAKEATITSPTDGLIDEIFVSPFDIVEAGQPLASLSNAPIDAQLRTAEAELDRIGSELGAARAEIQIGYAAAQREANTDYQLSVSMASLELPAELRAFYDSENALEFGILEEKLNLAKSELKIAEVKAELQRAQAKESRKDVVAAEGRIAILEAEAQSQRNSVSTQEARLAEGRVRRETLISTYTPPPEALVPEPKFDSLLAGWRSAMIVQEKRIAELLLEREQNIVRAPEPARVTTLTASQGHFAVQGEQILVLTELIASEVQLWIPETTYPVVQIGHKYEVKRAHDPGREPSMLCTVSALSPLVEAIPQRLWRDPRIAEYGRAIILSPDDPLTLLQGERVHIDRASSDAHAQ